MSQCSGSVCVPLSRFDLPVEHVDGYPLLLRVRRGEQQQQAALIMMCCLFLANQCINHIINQNPEAAKAKKKRGCPGRALSSALSGADHRILGLSSCGIGGGVLQIVLVVEAQMIQS